MIKPPLVALLALALTPGPTHIRAQDLPKPQFTPFTVAPALTNREEARVALLREYPAELRDQGIGGRATVWMHVTVEGRAEYLQIDESSGSAALDAAALRVADVFEFTPAMNRDRRIPVWISLPITFEVR